MIPEILGAIGSLAGGLFSKQKAPKAAPPVDIAAEQKKALEGNIASESDIEALLAQANTFSQGEANRLMSQALPGWERLRDSLTKTSETLLTDPYALPKDVEQNIARLAAERGISAGTRGEFNDFSLLRDFGVNALNYGASRIGQAQSITSMLAGLAPRVNPLSPMNFYITPAQATQVAQGNQSAQQAVNNATAAAGNYNNANMWSAISQGVGALAGVFGNVVAPVGGGKNVVNPGNIPGGDDSFYG